MTTSGNRLVARIGVLTLGSLLLLAGVAGIFLPVLPGIALLAGGIALLAREFTWARRVLDEAGSRMDHLRRRSGDDEDRRAA
jgi:uncharacterized membrane protein YbaN (DUF454 family)